MTYCAIEVPSFPSVEVDTQVVHGYQLDADWWVLYMITIQCYGQSSYLP
jgi:hypothetical protein